MIETQPLLPVQDRLRIGFVVPRFTESTVGGAENLALWMAQRLAGLGHSVEVLTTCAVDHFTWANELPAGTDQVRGLPVQRFLADDRDRRVHGEMELAIHSGIKLSREEEILWARNGVCSSAMEDELDRHGDRFDVILALPYLFGTTYSTYAARPDKTVVIPCLHDEPYARLKIVGDMLGGARGLMWNSAPEATLAKRLHNRLAPHEVVGVGFDPPTPGNVEAVRRRYKLPDSFMLYMGRVEGAKNVPLLLDFFGHYKDRRDNDLHLVLMGSGDVEARGRAVSKLSIDWADRDTLYAASMLLCQPSLMESFSIVMMQSWLARRPVLVHGDCTVTRYHSEESNGGLWFSSYPEFEEVVDRLYESQQLRAALGAGGYHYVRRKYSWEAVLSRFHGAVEQFFSSGSQSTERNGEGASAHLLAGS